jgi:hypothetical protein
MAKQIFVQKQHATPANTGVTAAGTAFHGGTAGDVGFYDVTNGDFKSANIVPAAGTLGLDEFQLVQSNGTDALPYASPIFKGANVKKISIKHADAAALTVATTAAMTVTSATVEEYNVVITVNTPFGGFKNNYEDFINPSNASSKHYDRGMQKWTASFTPASASAAAVRDAMTTAINELPSTCPVTATSASTANVTIAAKAGYTIAFGLWSDVAGITDGRYSPTFGAGSGTTAVSEEKKYGAYQSGATNALHLPMAPYRYASADLTYDVVTIELDPGDNQSINVPGNDSYAIEWWIPSAWTDAGSNLETAFAGAALGAVDMDSGASDGDTRVLYVRPV